MGGEAHPLSELQTTPPPVTLSEPSPATGPTSRTLPTNLPHQSERTSSSTSNYAAIPLVVIRSFILILAIVTTVFSILVTKARLENNFFVWVSCIGSLVFNGWEVFGHSISLSRRRRVIPQERSNSFYATIGACGAGGAGFLDFVLMASCIVASVLKLFEYYSHGNGPGDDPKVIAHFARVKKEQRRVGNKLQVLLVVLLIAHAFMTFIGCVLCCRYGCCNTTEGKPRRGRRETVYVSYEERLALQRAAVAKDA
ncbi:hypothetical protein BJ508DRAFT_5922 [Ascobolus immersus RN42]|uniref:Uncharacterized protein n=1 Tax=Ascobolus immersus RN42 TaxID=1160509 RepID=A0A3N4IIJ0_ASCIM|nr:hypothetical protein BJ508DRAFT_5922 [Ascobolus immersus RN42]